MANKHYTPEEDKILLREMNSEDSILSFDDKALSASNAIYDKLFIKRSTTSVAARYRYLLKVSREGVVDNKPPVYHSDPVKQAEAEEIIRRTNLPKEERENPLNFPNFEHLNLFSDPKNSTDAQLEFNKLLLEAEKSISSIDVDKYDEYIRSMQERDLFLNSKIESDDIDPGFLREIGKASKRKLRLMRTMIDHYLGE